jgi:hypothetical protein
LHKYDQPRFLRFWMEIFNVILTLMFSLIPYYKVNFNQGQIFTDNRDIENQSLTLNSIPYKLMDVIFDLIV